MHARDLVLTTPWLATEPAVRQILAIASRVQADHELAALIRAEREGRPSAVALQQGRPLDNTSSVTVRDGVAIIPVTGPIMRYANMFTRMSGATSTEILARDLQAALQSPMVNSVLLSIDSPGGEATGIHDLADTIYAARGKKPICAFVEGLGASAAYWIASACDEIAIEATAAVGSIGAVLAVPAPDPKASDIEFVSSQSPNKRADPTTEAGRSQYQTMVDDLATVFIDAVARNRGMDAESVIEAGGAGGLRVGRAAVAAGLADRVDTFENTLSTLRQRADGRSSRPGMAATTGDTMDWKAFWGGLFGAAAQAEGQPIAAAIEASAGTAPSADADEQLALIEQLALAQTQLSEQRQAARLAAASAFAERLVAEGRILPAEVSALITAHMQASADDALSDAGRVATLEGLFAARPAHTLTRELVEGPQDAPSGEGEDRVAALLALSPLGRTVRAAKTN